jgi:chromosomal replication initiator protein
MDKQIPTICTLDRHPLNHSQLHDNLISRLCQGLVLPLNTPGKWARGMIITELAHSLNVELTTTQRNNLLDGEHMSVPLLYQRILQIKLKKKASTSTSTSSAGSRGSASSRGVHFSRSTVTSRDSAAPGDHVNTTVCQVVAADFELSTRELCGHSRKQTTVLARGVAIYLLRSLYQLSFTAIGRVFAGRDHSTTIHAYQKINDRLSTDHALSQRIQRLSAKLQTMLPLLLTDEESPC